MRTLNIRDSHTEWDGPYPVLSFLTYSPFHSFSLYLNFFLKIYIPFWFLHSLLLCDHFFNLHSIFTPLYLFSPPPFQSRKQARLTLILLYLRLFLRHSSFMFYLIPWSLHQLLRHNVILLNLSPTFSILLIQFTHGSSIKVLQNRQATSWSSQTRQQQERIGPNWAPSCHLIASVLCRMSLTYTWHPPNRHITRYHTAISRFFDTPLKVLSAPRDVGCITTRVIRVGFK